MPPKVKKLTEAKIKAMLAADSDSEYENFEEIFGQEEDLEANEAEIELAQGLPSGSGDPEEENADHFDNPVESKT